MKPEDISCPLPLSDGETVQLAHGSGGLMSHRLLEQLIFPILGNLADDRHHDSAVFSQRAGRIAFTTDSFVVKPRFFPGGDIGSLAVHGTVNDLAMSGARPQWLSVGLILEEGMPLAELKHILVSLRRAADEAGVAVVTGDTKVVDRGKGDGLFIHTSGIGVAEHGQAICPASIRDGDRILLSGDIGRHGIAVMAVREGLAFETTIESDSAPLHEPVLAMIEAGLPIHCLRDLTRGGLASALKEIVSGSGQDARIREAHIPVAPQVRGACEMLGLDPLHVANEGRMIVVLPAEAVDGALEILHRFPISKDAVEIGSISSGQGGKVVLESIVGTSRVVDLLHGEQLPRIC